jgi:hypothetical protein
VPPHDNAFKFELALPLYATIVPPESTVTYYGVRFVVVCC